MNKFRKQAVSLTVLFLAWSFSFSQVPKQGPDSGYILYKVPEKTYKVWYPYQYKEIIKLCTVYQCPPVVPEFKWSQYSGTFQSFLDSASRAGQIAYLDTSVTPISTIVVPDGLHLVGVSGSAIIYNKHKTLFHLSNAKGRQIFENLTVIQDSIGTAFSRITFNSTYFDSLYKVNVIGGIGAYESSRGGRPDSMAVTAINRCYFENDYINISVFSQDGPWRALHIYNSVLKTTRSHNIYVHPATSLYYDSVASAGAGKLMQHQYSGTGNGGYGTGRYSVFKRVFTNGKPFEMTAVDSTLNNGYNRVWIEYSNIAPYVTGYIAPADVNAYKTNFYNAGNGIFLAGVFKECTGGVWSVNGYRITLQNCNMKEVSFRGGGQIHVYNSTVANMWGADRNNPWRVWLTSSTVGSFQDFGSGEGYMVKDSASTVSSIYRGSRIVFY